MIEILIVEDEKPISDLIRLNLMKAGYSCTCAFDGMEAADILEERNFDLIILDVMLMYGREAQSKTRIASPATIPKSGERNRKIHSCMLYLISI